MKQYRSVVSLLIIVVSGIAFSIPSFVALAGKVEFWNLDMPGSTRLSGCYDYFTVKIEGHYRGEIVNSVNLFVSHSNVMGVERSLGAVNQTSDPRAVSAYLSARIKYGLKGVNDVDEALIKARELIKDV